MSSELSLLLFLLFFLVGFSSVILYFVFGLSLTTILIAIVVAVVLLPLLSLGSNSLLLYMNSYMLALLFLILLSS